MTAPRPPADILVVDDELDVRQCLTLLLRREGYSVASAESGREALHWLCAGAPPRLILLDLAMPGMGGQEFLIARRSNPHLCAIPVVVFSAVASLAPIDPRRLGATAVFDKPYDFAKVLDVTRSYCPKRDAVV